MPTYGFAACSLVLIHPNIGQLTITGTGVGQIDIAMVGDRSTQETAADGVVVTNKIKDTRATLTVSLQQTSSAARELLKWFNYLDTAPTTEWAQMRAVLNVSYPAEQYVMQDVVFQKLPNRGFGPQQAYQSWALLVGDCRQNAV